MLEMLADDVAGVIVGLGLGQVLGWGHSMEAVTAAELAARHPALVRAVVREVPPLMDANALQPAPAREQAAATSALAFPDFRTLSEAERLAAARLNPLWHVDELPPWAESKAQFDPRISEHFFSFRAFAWRERLRQIQCPTLLLPEDPEAGARVTPTVAEKAVGLLAQIAGTGHNWSCPTLAGGAAPRQPHQGGLGLALPLSVLAANLPQLWTAAREADLTELSRGTWLFSMVDGLVWGLYALIQQDVAILLWMVPASWARVG